ncbi:MAG: IS3 family transposase [Prevotella sp.]|nr:IS3 family transposase [Alistipes senegalensis]MCM1358633.1 IS3 family transposase [Prevotella sp.]MCM1474110.1 IS3 family transposase [Muribaculaceae bacterium]
MLNSIDLSTEKGKRDYAILVLMLTSGLRTIEETRQLVVRRKKYYNYSHTLHIYDNLLNRDFKADRPNQKWVTGISYIKTAQGFLYLSVIRNLYDLSIVVYRTSTVHNINLVLNTIRAAKRKEIVTLELQIHSDQGVQYAPQAYFNMTEKYHITPSMSQRGNPYDNALAEKFFSIIKTECIHKTKINTFNEAHKLIDDYIYFYNHQCIQLKTKLTPLELRSQFVV